MIFIKNTYIYKNYFGHVFNKKNFALNLSKRFIDINKKSINIKITYIS